MFRLEMLPVGDGDCLIVSWGEEKSPYHLLVDGGLPRSSGLLADRLRLISAAGGCLELMVVTHLDADHIGGILDLCEAGAFPVEVREIWFNGYAQLPGAAPMSFNQADRLSKAIEANRWALNRSFRGAAVRVADDGSPVEITLPGGLKLTILSPNLRGLTRLRADWDRNRDEMERSLAAIEVEDLPIGVRRMSRSSGSGSLDVTALANEREESDDETVNGSSIAFIAEHGGHRMLLTADAHPDLLCASLRRLPGNADGRVAIDLFKLPHHGSRRNTSRELADLLDCGQFAVSASGSKDGRPSMEAIAKLLIHGTANPRCLHFSHRGSQTVRWEDAEVRAEQGLTCRYPPPGEALVVDISNAKAPA